MQGINTGRMEQEAWAETGDRMTALKLRGSIVTGTAASEDLHCSKKRALSP